MTRGTRASWRRAAALLACCAVACVAAGAVWARAGGGHTYGGGSSRSSSGGSWRSGSSGGSGGDGDLIWFLIRLFLQLIIDVPQIGVPILIVLLVVAFHWARSNMEEEPVLGGVSAPMPRQDVARGSQVESHIQRLQKLDPNFSRPLFLDFVGLLYARAVAARGTGTVEPVEPYIKPTVVKAWREALASRAPELIDEVVVGSVRITGFRGLGGLGAEKTGCDLEIEASYRVRKTETDAGRGVWTMERWSLERDAKVLSKGPGEIGKLGCPSCGAPCELKPDGRCTFCDQVVNRGAFAWQIASARTVSVRERPPADSLVSGGEEIGTDWPTRISPQLDSERRKLLGRHPEFNMAAFERIARETFFAVQQAWTSGDYEKARPLETDNLYNTHRYWLEAYKAAGLRNVLEDVRIDRVVVAKIEVDAFYESITVRIFASMKDYTQDTNGRLQSGSRSEVRRFSEYWTFIAAIGAPLTLGPAETSCPSCGAPMSVSQTGKCTHCDALVTSGKFGWVLSRIDQDEAYG